MANNIPDYITHALIYLAVNYYLLWLLYYFYIFWSIMTKKFNLRYVLFISFIIHLALFYYLMLLFFENYKFILLFFTKGSFITMIILNALSGNLFEYRFFKKINKKLNWEHDDYFFYSIYYGQIIEEYAAYWYRDSEDTDEEKKEKALEEAICILQKVNQITEELNKKNSFLEEKDRIEINREYLILKVIEQVRLEKEKKFDEKFKLWKKNKNLKKKKQRNLFKIIQDWLKKNKTYNAKGFYTENNENNNSNTFEEEEDPQNNTNETWNDFKKFLYDYFFDNSNEEYWKNRVEYIMALKDRKKNFKHPGKGSLFHEECNSWKIFFKNIEIILCLLWFFFLASEFFIAHIYPTGFTFYALYVRLFKQKINRFEVKFMHAIFFVKLSKLSNLFFSYSVEKIRQSYYLNIFIDLVISFCYLLVFYIRTLLFAFIRCGKKIENFLIYVVYYVPEHLINGVSFVTSKISAIIDFIKKFFGW